VRQGSGAATVRALLGYLKMSILRKIWGLRFRGLFVVSIFGSSWGCSPAFDNCTETRTCHSTEPHKEAGVDESGGASGAGTGGAGNRGGGGSNASGQTGSGGEGNSAGASGNASGGAPGGASGQDAGSAGAGGEAPDGGEGVPDGATDAATGVDASDAAPLVCRAGFLDCNRRASDGCEVDMTKDPDHCGSCTIACSTAGTAARACTAGVCKPTCDGAHLDCDTDGKNGCEVDKLGDTDHCGSCTIACSVAGTSARACNGGVCKATCDATHLDCDTDGKNGCEVNKQTDAANCGACKYACSKANASATSCVSGACTPMCVGNFAQCNSPAPAADDGCETDLTKAASCGACGHSCLGATCTNKKCDALYLAQGREQPRALTVDSQLVHWIEGGVTTSSVLRINVNGGAITTIASNQDYPTDIKSDGVHIYWSNALSGSQAMKRQPLGTIGDGETVFSNANTLVAPQAIAVDSTNVYWFDYNLRRTFKAPKNGSQKDPTTGTATGLSPILGFPSWVMSVDATNIYFAPGYAEYAPINADGAGTELFYPGSSSTSIAIDATYVYYMTNNSGTTGLARQPKTPGGAQQPITTFTGTLAHSMDTDANFLYFATNQALYKVAKTGGTPITLSTLVDGVERIVVTYEAVYWVNGGSQSSGAKTGSILKLAL
jgi:hypothetical protein